jgi:hypothetical protein
MNVEIEYCFQNRALQQSVSNAIQYIDATRGIL